MTLAVGLVPPALAADAPPAPDNPLEAPMADLALIEPPGGSDTGATPDLLVLDAAPPDAASTRVSILRRGGAWEAVDQAEVALAPGLGARWLVGLGGHRYALIATSTAATPGTGDTLIVGLEVRDERDVAAIVEVARQRLPRAVEYTASADAEGSGTGQLVLGLRPMFDASGSCGRSPLAVLDGATLTTRRIVDLPGRLGAGVVGRWDDVTGDDLLVYTAPECPPGGDGGARLVALRLSDGTESTISATDNNVATFPPPLRVQLDAGARDQAVVWTPSGLALVDGVERDPDLFAGGSLLPLVAGPDAAGGGSARVAWIDGAGLHASLIRRVPDGVEVTDRTDVAVAEPDAERWELLYQSTWSDIRRQGLSSAWRGDVTEAGCPDLILPGAIMPCGAEELRPGAAWLATRPVAAMPIEGRRGVLVAAGLGWDPRVGLPATPSPWAAGPVGRWRHGPSTPFALSEIRANDVAYFSEFPVPRATIDTTATREGGTVLPGFTGTRMFVSVTPLAEGEEGPDVAPSRLDGLRQGPGDDGMVGTVRVPVPPGNESGRDGAFTTMPLGDVRSGEEPSKRWSVRVVPVNDWGEVGFPVVGTVERDAIGPTLNMEVPFTNPMWPFLTSIPGRTEPGSTVELEGVGEMPIDERGRFHLETRLAPWPQTLRLTATDASGNASTSEFSIIGGVDYRRFPWALILALTLLGVVAGRSLVAAGKRPGGVEATMWSTGVLDEAARPEIEDLPPGGGLGSRS